MSDDTPEPWKASMDWRMCCHPCYDNFREDTTDEQRQFLTDQGLEFTYDSDDYHVRHVLLDKLERLDPDEHPDVDLDELIEAVKFALCPIDCNDCAESERDWLFERLREECTAYAKAHPDALWLVADWYGDAVSFDGDPDPVEMQERYFRSFNGYTFLTVKMHTPDAFAEVSFDQQTFTVHAFTDPVDQALHQRGEERDCSDARTNVAGLLNASRELRALMLDLATTHGEVHLPEKLLIDYWGDGVKPHSVYGCLEEADFTELATIARPLLSLDPQARAFALTMLPDSGPDWAATVAAVALAAA